MRNDKFLDIVYKEVYATLHKGITRKHLWSNGFLLLSASGLAACFSGGGLTSGNDVSVSAVASPAEQEDFYQKTVSAAAGESANLTVTLSDSGASQGYGGSFQGDTFSYTVQNLTGGTGDDTFTGNMSDNELDGADGDDTLSGGGGADTLNGGAGTDTLNGGAGADTLIGGAGTNTLNGDAGDDMFIAGDGVDTFNGGADIDTVSYADSAAGADGTSGVSVDIGFPVSGGATGTRRAALDEPTAPGVGGDAAGDTFSDIENIIGSGYNDSLRGNKLGNVLEGRGGNDTLRGEEGDDTLIGGADEDVFVVSVGNDTIADWGAGDSLEFKDLSHLSSQSQLFFTTDSKNNVRVTFDGVTSDANSKNDDSSITFEGVTNSGVIEQILSGSGLNFRPVITSPDVIGAPEDDTDVFHTVGVRDLDTGDILAFTLSGTDSDLFSLDSATGELSFINKQTNTVGSDPAEYDLTVVVSDGEESSDAHALMLILGVVNTEPSIGGGDSATVSVLEGSASVSGFHTIVATDAESKAADLSYDIVGGVDSALFSIGSSSGVINFLTEADFEAPLGGAGDNSNSYDLTVSASDGELMDTQVLVVNVRNVIENTAPMITGGSRNITENSPAAVFNLGAIDKEDLSDELVYTISGASSGLFTVNSSGFVVFSDAISNRGGSERGGLDYENPAERGPHVLTIGVTDSDGLAGNVVTVTIGVDDDPTDNPVINSAPMVTGGSTSIAENIGGVVFDLMASDDDDSISSLSYEILGTGTSVSDASVTVANSDLFSVNTRGRLVIDVSDGLNYETETSYVVTVAVSDDEGDATAVGNTVEVTINVTDVDESVGVGGGGGGGGGGGDGSGTVRPDVPPLANVAPMITGGVTSIAENIPGAIFNLGAIDPDDSILQLVYEVTGSSKNVDGTSFDHSDLFEVNNRGRVSVKDPSGLDYETGPRINVLTISVSDDEGDATAVGNTVTVTVNVTDVDESVAPPPVTVIPGGVNVAPTINGGAVSIFENSAAAVFNLRPNDGGVAISDLSYNISGTGSSYFTVDSAGFVVLSSDVIARKGLDYDDETTGERGPHVLTIGVSDGERLVGDSVTVTVTVLDDTTDNPRVGVNAAPTIMGGSTNLFEETDGPVYNLRADDDRDSVSELSYSISGDGSSYFTVNDSGRISVIGDDGLDYDILVERGPHTLTVGVSDTEGLRGADVIVTITVDNNFNDDPVVNNPPVIRSGVATSFTVNEGDTKSLFTAKADDTDILTYELEGDSSDSFSINLSERSVSLVNALDYDERLTDEQNLLSLTLVVSDGSSEDRHAFVVDIKDDPAIDPNRAPLFNSGLQNSFTVDEGQTIPLFTAGASDADIEPLTYTLSGDSASNFSINVSTGAITFLTGLDYDESATEPGHNIHALTVGVNDDEGATDVHIFQIEVDDANDKLPDLGGLTGLIVQAGFEGVLHTFEVLDTEKDTVDVLTYSITSDNSSLFSIVETGDDAGELSFVSGADLSNADDYTLDVSVHDGVNDSATFQFTVSLSAPIVLTAAAESHTGTVNNLHSVSFENATDTVSFSLADVGEEPLPETAHELVRGDKFMDIRNVVGGANGNELTGDDGDNILTGGAGADTLIGGMGDDTLIGGGAAAGMVDNLDGGIGTDTVSFAGTNGVTLTLQVGSAEFNASGGEVDGDLLTAVGTIVKNVENVIGSGVADDLTGNAVANVLEGRGGDDILSGGAGGDTLDGGKGIDTVTYAGASGGVTVRLDDDGFAGTVTVDGSVTTTASGGHASGDTLRNIEHLIGGDGDDTLGGNSGNNKLTGGAGADLLEGGGGSDTLNGGAGTDRLNGGDGDDTLTGDAMIEGMDGSMTAVLEADTFVVSGGHDTFKDFDPENDVITFRELPVQISEFDTIADGLIEITFDTTLSKNVNTNHGTETDGPLIIRFNIFEEKASITLGGFEAYNDALVAAAEDMGDTMAETHRVNQFKYLEDIFNGGRLILAGAEIATSAPETHSGNFGNFYRVAGGLETHSGSESTAVTANLSMRDAAGNIKGKGGTFEGDTFLDSITGLEGSSEGDELTGNAEGNFFNGWRGDDELTGLGGNDTLNGGFGVDTLDGGTGADILTGGTGADILRGGDGDDKLSGDVNLNGSGNDKQYGGTGNDLLYGSLGADIIDGGAGIDTVDYNRYPEQNRVPVGNPSAGTIFNNGITLTLSDGDEYVTVTQGANDLVENNSAFRIGAGDTVRGIENIIGSRLGDKLTGNSSDNILDGSSGDDLLTGGAGNDVFVVSAGTDTITDFDRGSIMGRDVLSFVQFARNNSIENFGVDRLIIGNSDANVLRLELASDGGVNPVAGANENVVIVFTGIQVFDEDQANDRFTQLISDDFIIFGDRIAKDENDVGGAIDFHVGNFGNNYKVNSKVLPNSLIKAPDLSVDLSVADAIGFGGSFAGDTFTNIRSLEGGSGDDTFTASDESGILIGAAGDDILTGGAKSDELYGGSGDDILTGRDGADILDGGDGVDILSGGSGDDILSGGAGDDISTGGDGRDIHLASVGTDTINDFTTGYDIISFENLSEVVDSTNFSYTVVGGRLALSFDTNGDADGAGVVDSSIIFGDISVAAGADVTETDANAKVAYDTFVSGRLFHDVIVGNLGDNILIGGAGNDRLDGGGGNDRLTGGAGNDHFVASKGVVRIKDFTTGDNTLSFEGLEDVSDLSSFVYGEATYLAIVDGDGNTSQRTGFSIKFDSDRDGTLDSEIIFEDIAADPDSDSVYSEHISAKLFHQLRYGGFNADTIEGGLGNDLIYGLGGADTISSFAGNDKLIGGTGADIIDGGAGDDRIFGGDDGDTLMGGTGDDIVDGDAGDDIIMGGYGDDKLRGDAGSDTLSGGAGVDILRGGAGVDTLDGGFGDDDLDGGSGVDDLVGGEGDDILYGGDGTEADTLDGGAGNDVLRGGFGDDKLTGGTGSDKFIADGGTVTIDAVVTFGGGTDTITDFGDGNDSLWFTDLDAVTNSSMFILTWNVNNQLVLSFDSDGASDDGIPDTDNDVAVDSAIVFSNITVTTSDEAETAFTDMISDKIVHSEVRDSGNTMLTGGIGNDVLVARSGADIINGGGGYDFVSYQDSTAGISVTINTGGAWSDVSEGFAAGDSITGVEGVIGSEFADVIGGGTADRTAGAYGMGGDDTFRLVRGDENYIDGGEGSDTLDFASFGNAYTVTLGEDNELATGYTRREATGDIGLVVNIENIIGSNDDDVFTGNSESNILRGRGGGDTLDGGAGIDTASYSDSEMGVTISLLNDGGASGTSQISGGDADGDILMNIENITGTRHNDVLTGNRHDNVFIGGGGVDRISGGDGNDTVSYANSATQVLVTLKDGTQAAVVSAGADRDILTSIENIIGSIYVDSLAGNSASNILDAGGGNGDSLTGGLGADIFMASRGANTGILDFNVDQLDVLSFGNFAYITDFVSANFTFSKGFRGQLILGYGVDGDNGSISFTGIENDSPGVSARQLFSDTILDRIDYTGSQTFIGTPEVDVFVGGLLNDVLRGGADNDILDGSDGDDYFEGGPGSDYIDGGAGFDTVSYVGVTDTVSVTLRSDGFSSVVSLPDEVDTLVNIENIIGGSGDDTLNGSFDSNILEGGAGNDTLMGFDDDDILIGGLGADNLTGGDGDDTASYSGDTVGVTVELRSGSGGIGRGAEGSHARGDTLGGIEHITGGSGDDDLTGNSGDNTLVGGDGDDILNGGRRGDDDILDGGSGVDTADYSDRLSRVTIVASGDVAGGYTTSGGAEGNILTNIENLIGSAYNDVLTGGDIDNTLWGRDGDDILTGAGGDDIFYGEEGNDTLGMKEFSFTITLVTSTGTVTNTMTSTLTNGVGDDELYGGAGDDILDGGYDDDILDGGADNDELTGGAGFDTFVISRGTDTIHDFDDAGSVDNIHRGNILLFKNLPNAKLAGFRYSVVEGNFLSISFAALGVGSPDSFIIFSDINVDTDDSSKTAAEHARGVYIEKVADRVFHNLHEGSDEKDVYTGTVGFDRINGFGGNDELHGGADNDLINGGAGDDKLYGDSHHDRLNGEAGTDELYGGIGNDILRGGADNDELFGGDGADELFGDSGDDELNGQVGADKIDGGEGIDTLTYLGDTAGVTVALSPYVVLETMTAGMSDDDVTALVARNVAARVLADDVFTTASGGWAEGDMVAGIENITGGTGEDRLSGHDGANILLGMDNNDHLNGRGGNDILEGGAGSDTLNGGWGDDRLDGGVDNDVLNGNSGHDTYVVSAGTDAYHSFEGDDPFFNRNIIIFDEFTDITDASKFEWHFRNTGGSLAGGRILDLRVADNDISIQLNTPVLQVAGLRRDIVENIEGRIYFQADKRGDDTGQTLMGTDPTKARGKLATELSADLITAEGGEEFVYGFKIDNTLIIKSKPGHFGNDIIYGGGGTDIIMGLAGNDILYGEAGDDILTGGDGVDRLYGGDGADTLNGNAGSDVLVGGAGDDTLNASSESGSEYFVGGIGTDTVSYDGHSAGVTIRLDNNGAANQGVTVDGTPDGLPRTAGAATSDRFLSIENLIGGSGVDILTGNDGANKLEGGGSGDMIDGGGGNDDIYGGAGTDTLNGNDGDDTLFGGGDRDILTGGTGVDTLHGNDGNDDLYGGGDGDILHGGDGTDKLYGEDGTDTLNGNFHDDELYGGANNDILNGHEGNDELDGGTGNDELFGGAGNDKLDGGAGNDKYTGGDGGRDTFMVSAGHDIYYDFQDSDTTQETVLSFENISGTTRDTWVDSKDIRNNTAHFVYSFVDNFDNAAGKLLKIDFDSDQNLALDSSIILGGLVRLDSDTRTAKQFAQQTFDGSGDDTYHMSVGTHFFLDYA